MENFNQDLINKIKLYNYNSDEPIDEKYAFIKYVFSNIESIPEDSFDICEDEFPELNVDIDAIYFDEDSNVYNLYFAIYSNENNDESSLTNQEILNEFSKLDNFIRLSISGKYTLIDSSSFMYEIAQTIFENINTKEIVINILSNYKISNEFKRDSNEEILNHTISFRTYDLDDLKNKFKQFYKESSILDCLELFNCELDALKLIDETDFEVYLLGMKGIWLAELYKQDSVRLLEANVRSYLKRTSKVNAGILATIKNSPKEFVCFNNGISAVATDLTISNSINDNKIIKIKKIDNFQIVNGGQTTATLYECMKDKLIDNLNDVIIPVKLTVVKNEGNAENLIRDISVYSNTQTAIKKSDPPSNLPYYIQIKKLSSTCISFDGINNYVCYFERTAGEYQTEFRRNSGSKRFSNANPKKMKFDKIDLARAINCWEQFPYITCDGREKNFAYFNDIVKNQIALPDETYFKNAYALIILYRKIDFLIKKQKLSYKSNIVAYTLSLISYLYDKEIDLMEIWNKKDLPSYLYDNLNQLIFKVHYIISNPPPEHPEARMWARKEQCWNLIKKINPNFIIDKSNKKVEFFEKNEALAFISDDNNFYNTVLWLKLTYWDNKFHILSKQQIAQVKQVRNNCDKILMTKKQIENLKDIFFVAVKNGFEYK